jgi:uncharacterized protein involved in exopolysaccharide biosynthesis
MNGLYDEAKIVLHSMWQRRWLALAVAWGLALLGWLVVALIPNTYESLARVSVESRQILSDTAGVSAGERQADIDRVRTTLTSAENMRQVVLNTDLKQQATSDRELAMLAAKLRRGSRSRRCPTISSRSARGRRPAASPTPRMRGWRARSSSSWSSSSLPRMSPAIAPRPPRRCSS